MIVEYVIPKGPKTFPEYGWIAGQNRACCTKTGRGRERNFWPKARGHWVRSPPLTEPHEVSHVHAEQAWPPGWNSYVGLSLQEVRGLRRSFCNLDTFFQWIPGPGHTRVSYPADNSFHIEQDHQLRKTSWNWWGETRLPVANMYVL